MKFRTELGIKAEPSKPGDLIILENSRKILVIDTSRCNINRAMSFIDMNDMKMI